MAQTLFNIHLDNCHSGRTWSLEIPQDISEACAKFQKVRLICTFCLWSVDRPHKNQNRSSMGPTTSNLEELGEFEREFSLQRRVTYVVERYSSARRNVLKWTNLLIYFLIRYFLRNQFVITIDTLFGRFVSQISIAPCGKILVS